MAASILSVGSKAAKFLLALVGRHSGYADQLKEELAKLENTRQGVKLSIDEARREMKLVKAHTEKWVTDVEALVDRAKMLEHDGRAKKTYLYRWLPNLKERYRLRRDIRRAVQDIQASIKQGIFEMVYYEHAPSRLLVGTPDANSSADDWDDTIIKSRASILEKVMNALDDEKLKLIGIYGPDGVGKTTLLEEVEKKLRSEKRLFDMIAKVKVSQTPKLKNIQDGIAYAFSLNLKDELSEEGRRDRLFREIQSDPTKKVLIILEDLGGPLDLKAVGIPSGYESRGCKLLLTSTFQNVLEQEMHADETIHLGGLNNDEALKLFEKIVGDGLKDEKLKSIATKVVKKLEGLPLLITSFASTLKYSDMLVWKNVLMKMDEPNIDAKVKYSNMLMKKGESNIDAMVRFCYNNLKSEEAKKLFLLCGLIGGTIQVETLLVLVMGLDLFEEKPPKRIASGSPKRIESIESSRKKLNTLLDSLRCVCLLLDGGDDKENATIHDLYSKVVVSTSLGGVNYTVMNSNYDSWSKDKLVKCWAIHLVNVVNGGLAELMSCCWFTNLKILMLSQPEDWFGSPTHRHDEGDCCGLDFKYMKELQVLYLRFMHITTLPSLIKILKNLRSLFLDNCIVEDVTNLGNLEALQYLSFVGSTISRLPKEVGKLWTLRLLNLSNCKKLQVIEPNVLESLVKLEELYMKGSFDRWVRKDEIPSKSHNARLAELRSLTKLTTLEISILDPTVILEANDDDFVQEKKLSVANLEKRKKLLEKEFSENEIEAVKLEREKLLKDIDRPFGGLIRFWINIGNLDGREFEDLRTMKFKLERCDHIFSIRWVKKTLQKTQYLHVDGLREFKNVQDLCRQGFRELKHLDIDNSPSIKYITNSSISLPHTAFTILESLFLKNLIDLDKICKGPMAPECFNKLKVVRIQKCCQLKNLWLPSEMQRLVHLEEIQVRECDLMQAIISSDAGKVEVVDDIVEWPNVRRMDLRKLGNMMSFCTRGEGATIQVPFSFSPYVNLSYYKYISFLNS
ncbi:hypothetical protein BT93_G0927 [Corymbia citriodora subsp. variegata]|nr:hypothetical protein BT93_G0927 [Corymbia citriodora subsp. variegata]